MTLGAKLLELRRQAGKSQEDVAAYLGVSRQTVSKWETDQTVPRTAFIKQLSTYYHVTSAYLMDDTQQHEDKISVDDIDWTAAWSEKYPVLKTYRSLSNLETYEEQVMNLYDEMKERLQLNDQDTFLILKDFLYQKYKKR